MMGTGQVEGAKSLGYEHLLFTLFLDHEFSLLVSSFLRELLDFYGIHFLPF